MSAFDELQAISPQTLADGYLARVVHGDRLTLAIVEIQPGAVLPEHEHENEQFGMVIEGSVVFQVGEQTQTIQPGGIWRIPSRTRHTATGGPNGAVVMDVFSPAREDWVDREQLAPRHPRWPRH